MFVVSDARRQSLLECDAPTHGRAISIACTLFDTFFHDSTINWTVTATHGRIFSSLAFCSLFGSPIQTPPPHLISRDAVSRHTAGTIHALYYSSFPTRCSQIIMFRRTKTTNKMRTMKWPGRVSARHGRINVVDALESIQSVK